MLKYFLFNKEQVGPSSTDASDTGIGISVISIPASSLSYMTATSGFVNLVFNNSGVFDYVDLAENESIKKTTINIQCKLGEEAKLIEDITNFIVSANTNQSVMKFDFVESKVSFIRADIQTPKSIFAKVHDSPAPLKPRTYDNTFGLTSLAIGKIKFTEETYPILDLNTDSDSNFSNLTQSQIGPSGAQDFTSWNNASQLPGASLYSFEKGQGNSYPYLISGTAGINYGTENTNGLGTWSVYFPITSDDLESDPPLLIASDLFLPSDYTIYMVLGVNLSQQNTIKGLGEVYGGYAQSFGPFPNNKKSSFSVRHEDRYGVAPEFKTASGENGTTPYEFPNNDQTCYVFVVRRDKSNNLFLHNYAGDIVGYIESKSSGSQSTPLRTDGPLVLQKLGYGSNIGQNNSFYGNIARFGVIERDIGVSEAAKLAISLYDVYKPYAYL
jgi:hypothetical protein